MKLHRTVLLSASLVCLLAFAGLNRTAAFSGGSDEEAAKESTNWPGWRGLNGSGVSAETNLPTEWSDTKNVLWKTSIPGKGHSSPIVWGNRVFVTTAVAGEKVPGAKRVTHYINGKEFLHPDGVGADVKNALRVIALDRDTGKIVWERTAYDGLIYDTRHRRNSRASETPVTDGKYVFAYFGSAGLYAYDFHGNLKWTYAVGNIGSYGVGTGTSPVLYKGLVLLQVDSEDGKNSYIVALNKSTGKELWRKKRAVQSSWATPLLVQTQKRDELVTNGNEFIIAYDPANGKELWRTEGVKSNAIPTPVAGHGLVFVSAGFPDKRVIAVKLGGSDDLTGTDSIAWKYNKGTGYMPSPILYGDYLYLISSKGIMTCLEASTGKVIYDNGRVPVPASFASSILAYEGKLLISSMDGDTFVIEAGTEHKVLRTNSIGEPIWATPAISDGKLFLRGEKTLYAIGKGASE